MTKFLNVHGAYYNINSIKEMHTEYRHDFGQFVITSKMDCNDRPIIVNAYDTQDDASQALKIIFENFKGDGMCIEPPRQEHVGRLYARMLSYGILPRTGNPVVIRTSGGRTKVLESVSTVDRDGNSALVDSAFLGMEDTCKIDMRFTHIHTIGTHSFNLCKNLVELTLPQTIKKIGPGNFMGCDNLKTIGFMGTKYGWDLIEKDPLWNVGLPKDCMIHCSGQYDKPFAIDAIDSTDRERETC